MAWRALLASALALLLVPAAAPAADLAALRRAVAQDDRAAVERWLAAEARAKDADPLSPLGRRPASPELEDKAGAVADQDVVVAVLAYAYARGGDPAVKRELLSRLDAALAARQALAREVQQAARAPEPTRLVFTQLFTAGVGQGAKLAEPTSEFAPEEPAIHVRFVYEGATPGEELASRWLRSGPGGPAEFARSAVKLAKAGDRGQFSFAPSDGTRWVPGLYRVELSARGGVVAAIDFLVRGPASPVASAVAPPDPIAAAPAPAVPAPPAPPAGPVSVLDAALVRDVEQGEARDPATEFSTARRRLVLWARVQAPAAAGGALTARWYATDGGDRLLGEHTLAVPPGESRVAYWLEAASDKVKFKRGRLRVDLVAGDRVVKQLPFRIRQAGFLEEIGGALEQLGKELDKVIKGDGK